MKKRIIALFAVLLLTFSASAAVYAVYETANITENAEVLNEQNRETLRRLLSVTAKKEEDDRRYVPTGYERESLFSSLSPDELSAIINTIAICCAAAAAAAGVTVSAVLTCRRLRRMRPHNPPVDLSKGVSYEEGIFNPTITRNR